MNLSRFFLMTLAITVFPSFIFSATDSLKMYLCTGHEQSGTKKLVYGYINGKKTECMSEYELRVATSQARLQQEKKHRTIAQWRQAVYHGEKNLVGANLKGCDLKDVDLSGADLTDAQLASADLRGANLENALLKGANLENTYCKNTNLKGADLTGATIRGTYFHFSNLIGTKGIVPDQLQNVATVYQAHLEKTTLETVKKTCPKKLKNPKNSWNREIFENEDDIPSSGLADPSSFK